MRLKEFLSVEMLMARLSVYKVLAVIAALAAVQGGIFYYYFQRSSEWGLPGVMGNQFMVYAFIGALVGVVYVLGGIGSEKNSKVRYTLLRLSVSEKQLFWCQCLHNSCMFFLLWAGEILIMLGLCRVYGHLSGQAVFEDQSVFLLFYLDDFSHNLLPMAAVSGHIRNGMAILAAGVAMAYGMRGQRREKNSVAMVLPLALLVSIAVSGGGSMAMDIFYGIGFAIIIGVTILIAMRKESGDEEEA